MGPMPRQCTITAPEGKGRGWEIGEQGIRPFRQRSGIRAADRLGAVFLRSAAVESACCTPRSAARFPPVRLFAFLILPASNHPLS